MSKYFVTDPDVAIVDPDPDNPDRPDIIWIKARMDVTTQAKTSDEVVRFGAEIAGAGTLGLALLVHNITRWEGPSFDSVPLTRENICKLDPRVPHIELVINELGERNRRGRSGDQKKITGNGSSSAGSKPSTRAPSVSEALANGMTKSTLPSGSTGRRSRSGG